MDTSFWMSRELLTVTPGTAVQVAARRMAERRVRHLLVVEHDGSQRLCGLVSSHDLFLAAESGIHPFSPVAAADASRTVGEIMTVHPVSIPSNTSLAAAARLLRDKKWGCLPVVDGGVLVGILTEHDLLRAFLRMSGADEPGYEVTCVVADGRDALAEMSGLARQRGLRVVSATAFDHDGKHYGVLHVSGKVDDAFVDALWRCGHTILRVSPTAATRSGPALERAGT